MNAQDRSTAGTVTAREVFGLAFPALGVLAAIPSGCPFNPRCPMATEKCRAVEPELTLANAAEGHLASCHRLEDRPKNRLRRNKTSSARKGHIVR